MKRSTLFCALFGSLLVPATAAEPLPRLEKTNLLAFRDASGEIRPVTTISEWDHRRHDILAAMERIMGTLPGPEKRCSLDVKVEEEIDAGDHVRRLLSYQSEPGGRVPAYLLIPKAALATSEHTFPAVLCLHPTDATRGHKTVVLAEGAHPYALELTRRGFVTIAPAYPLLANYQPDLRKLGYASGTMKAIWDNIRALDLLQTLAFVKADGFGVIGHSLGGHNAIYTAVFDPRVKAIVSSCGFDSFTDYYSGDARVWQPGQGWTQERYMPRLAMYAGRLAQIPFDFHEVVAALAPRPVFVNAPLYDSNFQARSVDEIVAAAKRVYALYGAVERLEVAHPDCAHDFPAAMRERAYGVLEGSLR